MQKQDIDLIVQGVGYLIFVVVYFSFKKVGKFMLEKDPDNLLVPLYYFKQVKVGWQIIYDAIIIFCFVAILIAGVDAPYAAFISVAISIYSVTAIARAIGKNIWKNNQPPKLEVSVTKSGAS